MLKIKSGKVLLDGVDITDRPVFNYVWLSHNGSVIVRPSPFEDRSEWTCIITEIDDDRVRYSVFWRDRFIEMCNTREEAEKVLEICDEKQWEADHCKDDYYDLDWLE